MTERSLSDEIRASIETLSAEEGAAPSVGGGEPANQAQPAPTGEAGQAAATATPDPAAETKIDATGRAHAPDGKFAPKGDKAPATEGAAAAVAPQAQEPAPTPETATPAAAEPQSAEAIRVPPSLPAALKAKFGTLDPDVQQAFVALEDSVQKAKAEWGPKGQRLNRFDEIIGPRLARWQMNGVDEFQGIQMLLAAQDILDRDPVQGLVQVGRSYGVSPAQIAQAFGLSQTSAPQAGQEGQSAPTASPDLQVALQTALSPLLSRFQTLEQGFTQQQQAAEAAEINRLAAEVRAFANDPKNLYFNDVSDDVVELMRAARSRGQEMSLSEAYERAVWAHPTIRPLIQKAEAGAQAAEQARAAAEAAKQAEQAARAKAANAQASAGSVIGSPAPGSQAPGGGSTGNLREDIVAAMQAQTA